VKVKIRTHHHGILWEDVSKSNIFGDFAVVPARREDDNGRIIEEPCGWNITHIPTGRSALFQYTDGTGYTIAHEKDARELARRYAALPKETIDMGRLGDKEAMSKIKQTYRNWREGASHDNE
jgi:hypothetical protein